MAQATAQRDTLTASVVSNPGSSIMVGMTLQAVPETPWECDEAHEAVVIPLTTQAPNRPTDEQIAAKKARRHLDAVTYERTQSGTYKARYFNEEGFDAYGYDARGNYDPAQRTTDACSPFHRHI